MPSCTLKYCNSSKANIPNLTLHRFPKNPDLRQKWLDIVGVDNLRRHKGWHLCSLHFDDTLFNRTLDCIRLRENATPSLHLLPTEIQNSKSQNTSNEKPAKIQNTKPQVTTNAKDSIDISSVDPENNLETSQTPCFMQIKIEQEESLPSKERNIKTQKELIKFLTKRCAQLQWNSDRDKKQIQMLSSRCKVLKRRTLALSEKVRRRDVTIEKLTQNVNNLMQDNFLENDDIIIMKVVKSTSRRSKAKVKTVETTEELNEDNIEDSGED